MGLGMAVAIRGLGHGELRVKDVHLRRRLTEAPAAISRVEASSRCKIGPLNTNA